MGTRWGSIGRRVATGLVAGCLAGTVVVMAAPVHQALAVNGSEIRSSTIFRVDGATGLVHVEANYLMRNTTPSKRTSGGFIEYYYTGLTAPIDTSATNLVVTVDHNPVKYTVKPPETATDRLGLIDVKFGKRLKYGMSFNTKVTYDLAGQPPRSEDPDRANPAYSAFLAYGFGDPGVTTVRVEIPEGWQSEYLGDDLHESPGLGVTVYETQSIDDPFHFVVLFTARNDAGLKESDSTTPDNHPFVIRAWPNDEEWRGFVSKTITKGVPALEDLIGSQWPEDNKTEVIETVTPYLRGYAGWYNPVTDVIEIGEDLDDQTVLHELSHAWFNRSRFSERWINEGFAEELASKAVGQIGGKPIDPEPVFASDAAAIRLEDWNNPTGDADAVEDFAYRASFKVMRDLTDEIGMDKLKAVMQAAEQGLTAYPGDGDPEGLPSSIVDWRRLLDLVEQYGGSTKFESLLKTWVVPATENSVLDQRTAARKDLQVLDDEGGQWAPPLFVRRDMDEWKFVDAETGIKAATAVLDRLPALNDLLAKAELTISPDVEKAYESADENLDAVNQLIDTEAARAQKAIDDKAAAEKKAAEDAAAAAAAEKARQEELQRQRTNTAQLIADARTKRADADGFFQKLGLDGKAVDALLNEADALAAADQFDQANAKVQEANAKIDDASSTGRTKALTFGGIGLGGLVLLSGLGVVLVRGKRRRKRAALTPPATAPDLTPMPLPPPSMDLTPMPLSPPSMDLTPMPAPMPPPAEPAPTDQTTTEPSPWPAPPGSPGE